jgi:hypothetical protein
MFERTDLVKRLAATPFKGDLRVFDDAEAASLALMNAYQGYLALSTAFMRFFLETTAALDETIPRTAPAHHRILLEKLVHGFQTLRAAQLVAHHGYPMQGFTLLRNIHDDCVLMSAVMQGLTDFEELAGGGPGAVLDRITLRKNRIKAEHRVRSKIGRRSERIVGRDIEVASRAGRDVRLGDARRSDVPVTEFWLVEGRGTSIGCSNFYGGKGYALHESVLRGCVARASPPAADAVAGNGAARGLGWAMVCRR